jgi:N utilization substance protein B
VREQRRLDPLIDKQLAEGWRLNRVDSILRAILRAGAYELALRDDVPARVVISEYLDIAHAFFGDEEPRVVNGILDRLAHKARPKELASRETGNG